LHQSFDYPLVLIAYTTRSSLMMPPENIMACAWISAQAILFLMS
jgi:hypothetical protein